MTFGARLWHAVRHDIGRKLTALGLAAGVWMVLEGAVLDEQSEELDVRVVTSIQEADRERLIANRSTVYLVAPETLQVQAWEPASPPLRVKGLKDDVRGLVMTAVLEFVESDLQGRDQATVQRTLGRENFRGRERSPELTLFRINYDATVTLTVRLVRRSTVSLTLSAANVNVTGQPAKGYVYDSAGARPRPTQVTVSGPASIVDRYRDDPTLLKLAPVSVENSNRAVIQSVGLDKQNPLNQNVTMVPETIEISVSVSPKDMELKVFALPITYKNEAALADLGFRLEQRPPESRDVLVRGPAPELNLFEQNVEQLARKIDLVFDYRQEELVAGPQSVALDCFTKGLPLDVKVLALDGRGEPRIEFKLAEVEKGP